jgi:hypothetical protein
MPIILPHSGDFINAKPQILCSHCSGTAVIRHGTYGRYKPGKDTKIPIQRYLCKSPGCKWRTFSVLPYQVLPVIRHNLEALFDCYRKQVIDQVSQAALARYMQISRGVARRLADFSRRAVSWMNHECTLADWGCALKRFWEAFTRDFSQNFFPGRWIKPAPTQFGPFR